MAICFNPMNSMMPGGGGMNMLMMLPMMGMMMQMMTMMMSMFGQRGGQPGGGCNNPMALQQMCGPGGQMPMSGWPTGMPPQGYQNFSPQGCGCCQPQFGARPANPSCQIPNYGPDPNKAQINSMIEAACQKYGVPFEVAKAVAYKESGWNPRASSFDGGHGKGIMQIDDRSHAFARSNAVWDPAANIDYGVRLLAENYKKSGNWRDACRRYNGSGPMAERYANNVMGLTQTQPWQRFGVA